MKPFTKILYTIATIFLLWGCDQQVQQTDESKVLVEKKPNIILIMADDMGYECLGVNGSTEYRTPNLDRLAANGVRFTSCISQPLCTPSRVKIMTGLRNYRNYEYFGYLNPNEKTFAHLLKDAGYATCVVGKWQLNGFYHNLPGSDNPNQPYRMGFDEYCLWQLTVARGKKDGKPFGERYADPLIEQNGERLQPGIDAYGPDLFVNYLLDFVERKKDSTFFIYYPMVLVHDPFVPTPNSEAWGDQERRYEKDTAYFKDMMAYTDKIMGRITYRLQTLGLSDNTLLIFTADNGTHIRIQSQTEDGVVQGGKGNTIDAGVHVPLIAHWPEKIKEGKVYEDLIEFSDFFPTLADVAKIEMPKTDGESFYNVLIGEEHTPREQAFVHYDPQWGGSVNQYRNQFAQTTEYKLYQDGRFVNVANDPLEKKPLDINTLSEEQQEVFKKLEGALDTAPPLPDWENQEKGK